MCVAHGAGRSAVFFAEIDIMWSVTKLSAGETKKSIPVGFRGPAPTLLAFQGRTHPIGTFPGAATGPAPLLSAASSDPRAGRFPGAPQEAANLAAHALLALGARVKRKLGRTQLESTHQLLVRLFGEPAARLAVLQSFKKGAALKRKLSESGQGYLAQLSRTSPQVELARADSGPSAESELRMGLDLMRTMDAFRILTA
jgi:hypothetical protein